MSNSFSLRSGLQWPENFGDLQQLMQKARDVRSKSFSPYSQFKVGVVIGWESGLHSVGCNVENSSFGATICAERSAIASHIAGHGVDKIRFVLVMTAEPQGTSPCGICLQTIAQFASPHTQVIGANESQVVSITSFYDYLPKPFTSF